MSRASKTLKAITGGLVLMKIDNLCFTVDEAMKDRFRESNMPRSEAYRAGFKEQLLRLIEDADQTTLPFDIGTPEADAYFSGQDHATEYCKTRKVDPLYD